MTTKAVAAVLGLFGLAILLLLWRPDSGAADPITLGAPAPVPQAVTPEAAAAGERKAAPSEAPVQFAKSRDFDAVFAELLQALVPPGSQPPDTAEGIAAARRQMDHVRELVAEIVTCFPDAGQRGFHRLATLAAPWQEAAVRREAQAAGMVVDFWMQRTHDQPARRPVVTELVHGMLRAMGSSADMAGSVRALLVDKKYLVREHEQDLLALAAAAGGDSAFLRGPVRDLLLTLWRNVGGDNPDALLRDLLLYFADDAAGALADAALQRLLLDARYRAMVLNHLIASKDAGRLRSAADHAVKNLPFQDALDVVRSLQCGVPQVPQIGAYAWLGVEHAAELKTEYERCLADNAMPIHRELLVVGAGNAPPPGSAAGIACAATAFASDPSPKVRGIAFLAMCNQGAVREAQDGFLAAMNDTSFASRHSVAYMVSGLEALARRSDRDVNFLDRATSFLLVAAGQEDKSRIERLRATCLPQ